jgi:hypothetical protein
VAALGHWAGVLELLGRLGRRRMWRTRRLAAVVGIAREGVPQAARGGKREAGAGVRLVRVSAEIAATLDALAPGARGAGPSVPGAGGRVRGGQCRGRVADVMLRGTGDKGAGHWRAVRVALVRRVTVMSAGRGSGDLGAAQAEAGHLADQPAERLEGGRLGRASLGTGRRGGKAVARPVSDREARGVLRVAGHQVAGRRRDGVVVTGTWAGTGAGRRGGVGRSLGHSGVGMVAGKAVGALESVHLLPGVAAMAERVARALGRRAAPSQGRRAAVGQGRRAAVGQGRGRVGSLVPGATIGRHGGRPVGSG